MSVSMTSIISYIANLEKLGEQQKQVMLILKKYNKPMNNRMILTAIRQYYPYMESSNVCARMKELRSTKKRKFPFVVYSHIGVCPITNEQVKFYKLNQGIRDILA